MAHGPEVMLATPSKGDPADVIISLMNEGWAFEIKFDGIRAVVTRDAQGVVRIYNRRQLDITHRYPDVVAQLSTADWAGVVDGEIVVPDPNGRPDFSLAHLRDAQSSQRGVTLAMTKAPAMFMPFDALEENGFDLRNFPYSQRRARLAAMFPRGPLSVSNPEGHTMWHFVRDNALEGLVAKRLDSAYRPGRQKAWVKIKSTHRLSALVCGVIEGKGSRQTPIGALRLCLWNPDTKELTAIGKVGSGLSAAVVRDISARLSAKQPVVVEVEFLEVSSSGQLRMPIFRGVRQDVAPEDCTVKTLTVRTSSRSASA
jgi:bifunctional non-homologous end joining protein LigD